MNPQLFGQRSQIKVAVPPPPKIETSVSNRSQLFEENRSILLLYALTEKEKKQTLLFFNTAT